MIQPIGKSSDVTVLVVGYNHAAFVNECLDSIVSQEVRAELRIRDDMSTDNSDRIIRKWIENHPDVNVLYQRNSLNLGLTRTLNDMLVEVSTRYVTYISADDTMLPGRLQRQLDLMRRTGVELSYTDAIVFDEKSEMIYPSSRVEFPWPNEPERSADTLACLVRGNWIPAASIMMVTSALREVGAYNERLFYEDYELLLRTASRGWRFAYDESQLVGVRRVSTSLGANEFRAANPEFIFARGEALAHVPQDGGELAREVLSIRWELAKRLSRVDNNGYRALANLWNARFGAGSGASRIFHLIRSAFALYVIRPIRRVLSR